MFDPPAESTRITYSSVKESAERSYDVAYCTGYDWNRREYYGRETAHSIFDTIFACEPFTSRTDGLRGIYA